MFEILITNEARKFLKNINKTDKLRIINSIERCRVRPHHYVKKLINSPYYRLRIGKYRAILDIKSGKLIIIVLEIGHRRNIYK